MVLTFSYKTKLIQFKRSPPLVRVYAPTLRLESLNTHALAKSPSQLSLFFAEILLAKEDYLLKCAQRGSATLQVSRLIRLCYESGLSDTVYYTTN